MHVPLFTPGPDATHGNTADALGVDTKKTTTPLDHAKILALDAHISISHRNASILFSAR